MQARARCGGFTYLGTIILVAIIGLVGAASLKVGSLLQRAAAEEELLDIGAAFTDALRSYAAATPQGQPQQPNTLDDLLKDPRFPNPRRHLRKIFVDPITGKAEWGVMYLGDKVGVLGVYSLSDSRPLKVANFDARFLNMENKEKLSDWKFTMSSQSLLTPEALAVPPPPAAPPSLFGPKTAPAEAPLRPKAAPPVEAAPPEEPPAEMAEQPEPEEKKSDEKKADDDEPEKDGEKDDAPPPPRIEAGVSLSG